MQYDQYGNPINYGPQHDMYSAPMPAQLNYGADPSLVQSRPAPVATSNGYPAPYVADTDSFQNSAPVEPLSSSSCEPVTKRKAHDVACLVIFILFWLASIYFAVDIAQRKPDLEKTYHPIDVYGRFCGHDAAFNAPSWHFAENVIAYNQDFGLTHDTNYSGRLAKATLDPDTTGLLGTQLDMTAHPLLFWPIYNGNYKVAADGKITDGTPLGQYISKAQFTLGLDYHAAVCVTGCPDVALPFTLFGTNTTDGIVNGGADAQYTSFVCHKEVQMANDLAATANVVPGMDFAAFANAGASELHETCKPVFYKSVKSTIPGIYNRCLPKPYEETVDSVIENSIGMILDDSLLSILSQASIILPIIAGVIVVAILCGYVFLFGMRFCAKVFAWILIIALGAGLVYMSYYCWTQYAAYDGLVGEFGPEHLTSSTLFKHDLWLGVAIAVIAVTVIYFIIVLFMAKRINFAIAIIVEAGHVMTSIFTLWLVPIIFTILTIVCAFVVAVGVFFVWSAGSFEVLKGHRSFLPTTVDKCAYAYFVFGFFWIIFFLRYLMQTIVCGAAAGWYWRMDKKKRVRGQVWQSTKRACKYHMGSVAFAAFWSALLWWILWLLHCIEKKVREATANSDKQIAVRVLKFLKWLTAIIGRIVDFLNKYAIVEIAVYGESYCRSAKRAAKLITSNPVRFFAINTVGDALLVIGRVGAAMLCALVAGASVYYGGQWAEQPGVQDMFGAAAIVAGIIGLVIADCFYDTYEIVVDSIVMCFLEDMEANDGSAAKPYYMTDRLACYAKASKKNARTPDLADSK